MERIGNKSEQVAKRVLAHLEGMGHSQRWLSEQTSIPLTTLNRRVQGRSPFTVDELFTVATVLEVPITQFVLGEAA